MVKLNLNDNNSILSFLNKEFSDVSVEDVRDILESKLKNPGNTDQKKVFKLLSDSMDRVEFLRLKDDQIDGPDAFLRLKSVFENLHYDNGLPLSGLNYPEKDPTEENDYFDHFDRIDEFWSYFNGFLLEEFKFDSNGNLVGILELTYDDLKILCKDEYEGSSWKHDFSDIDNPLDIEFSDPQE